MKKIFPVFITLLLAFSTPCLGGERTSQPSDYKGFKTIKTFGGLVVTFRGSAANIGLDKDELTDHLKANFINRFGKFDYHKIDNLYQASKDKDLAPTIGYTVVEVWTVGENYPVVYHISLFAGNLTDITEYSNGNLGYDKQENIPQIVKTSISSFIEEMAKIFFDIRGEHKDDNNKM